MENGNSISSPSDISQPFQDFDDWEISWPDSSARSQYPNQVSEAESSFKNVDWVVNMSRTNFHQNRYRQGPGMSKWNWEMGGGIVGITKTVTALSQWALSFSMIAHISDDKEITCAQPWWLTGPQKATSHRRTLDSETEDKIFTVVKHFGVFAEAVALTDELCNIAKEAQAIKINKKARSSRKRYDGTILNESGETTWKYKYVQKNNNPSHFQACTESLIQTWEKTSLLKPTDLFLGGSS